jgi:aerotolerance regulator-like protein
MGLLKPLDLLFLLSLGVLVIIYVRARSRPTVEVSSLMLFDEIPAPVVSARWLRVDLPFWLEVLALSALSVAAAGLYLRMPAPVEHVRRHALVFDLGAAMAAREGNTTRLEEAKREALKIIADAPAGDTFSVIGYALEARVVHPASARRESIRSSIAALNALAVPVRPAALFAALMRAHDADTIDLFADRLPPGRPLNAVARAAQLRFHQVGSAADNLAIVSLDPGSVATSPGHCVVRNFSQRPKLCDLAIDRGGDRVLRTSVMIEPRGQVMVPFGPLSRGGLVSARILSDDPLTADNQRWAYAQEPSPDHVLLVSPDPKVRDDLARVLLAVNQNFIVTAIDAKKFEPAEQPGDLRLAVMHDFYDPRVKAASRLLVYPSLAADFPVGATVPAGELRESMAEGELAEPIPLGPVRLLNVPSWMEVTAAGAAAGNRQSMAIAAFGRDRNGLIGLIAFDVRNRLLLDPDKLEALVVTVDMVRQLTAPDDLQIVRTGSYASVSATHPARVLAPDGIYQTVRADEFGRIRFSPLQAGRYRVELPDRTAEIFANYFDAAESDLAIGSPSANVQAETSRTGAIAPGASLVRQLDPSLLALALFAFLAESAIIGRRAARGRWRHV